MMCFSSPKLSILHRGLVNGSEICMSFRELDTKYSWRVCLLVAVSKSALLMTRPKGTQNSSRAREARGLPLKQRAVTVQECCTNGELSQMKPRQKSSDYMKVLFER